ncbi:MAG TPA: DEAD/DEAH box helicase, partial [Planctomycetota bacterium]|nr:DEAD/DEAH box helicase [Planctomycetota bacterium]
TGIEILVTTPKRLLELMREKAVKLASIEIAVIDDVDQMIDEGFEPDLNKVVSALPGSYQTVAFAAAPAPELRPFVQSWMRNPLSIGGPAPARRKAAGKAASGKKASTRQVASTLKLPDWLDEPPPELMPDWLEDEPGTAASAPASGAKKPKGTTRRVPTPAEAAAQPPATAKQAGGGKKPEDDLPAWLDDEPAAKAPASAAKTRKRGTRRVPTPAEAGDESAPPSSTEQEAGSGKKPEDDLPAWLDDEPAAKTRKRGTRKVPTPAEAGDAQGQPPPPEQTPPPPKKAGTRRKGSAKGKTGRARP